MLAAALVLAPTLLATEVQAGGKGLRVFLTINTNLVSQPVEIDTYQFDQFLVTHQSYMDNGETQIEINYEPGEVVNGEFKLCAYAMEADMERCVWGYDSEAKEPVYFNVDFYGSYSQPVENNRGNSQSQSSANNNENNNAQSQSQETTIIICNNGKCEGQ